MAVSLGNPRIVGPDTAAIRRGCAAAEVVPFWIVNADEPRLRARGAEDCDGGTHQLYPGMSGTVCEAMAAPLVYRIELKVAAHSPGRKLLSAVGSAMTPMRKASPALPRAWAG